MELLFISAYFAFFIGLAWINFRYAICFFILLLPIYLIRFNIGPLPSTLLEISFGAIALTWAIKYFLSDWKIIKDFISRHRIIFLIIFIFFFATLIAALANPIPLKALGIWRAYFLEPVILFFILIGRYKQISSDDLIKFLAWSAVSVSLLAIIQKITGHFYPPSLWDDELSGRPTSFFTSPNAIGLYLVPIILLMASLFSKNKKSNSVYAGITSLALVAVIISISQGAWVALAAGAVLTLYLIGRKKIAVAAVIIGMLAALLIPQIRMAVFFTDQAGQNRLTLWKYSTVYLTESPRNFILGAGLRRFFTDVQKPYYNVEKMERLIYPHNIFLNFWLETGFLGLAAFTGILICLFYLGAKILKENRLLGASIIGALTVLVVHGLVDVPYFKNDLSMIFWIIAATILISANSQIKNPASSD